MTTSAKLWLGFGLLTGLLVLSTAAIIFRVVATEDKVDEMANVARPRMTAANSIETGIRGYALAVRVRLQGVAGSSNDNAAEEAAKVRRHLADYRAVAQSDHERDLANRFLNKWAEFEAAGQQLLSSENFQISAEDSKKFYDLSGDLESFLRDEVQPDAVEAYNISRDAALGSIRDVHGLTLFFLIAGSLVAVVASVVVGRDVINTEARRTAMFETALDCIISIDHRGTVTEFNPAAEKTFGYTRDEAIGGGLAELIIPPALREAHRRGLAHYLATGDGPVLNTRVELTALRSSGEEFPVELSITRVGSRGMPQFTAYLRDITERKQAEQHLLDAKNLLESRVERRTAELRISNEALERSNKELEQFASIASHDLQEPLRKIQAFGDRLATNYGDKLGEKGQTYVERMNFSATRMRSLINSLLQFSRVTTQGSAFAEVDLGLIAAEAVSDLEARIRETGGRVEIGELPIIDADSHQMGQLFLNLISNGLKFHKPGEPSIVKVSAELVDRDGPAYAILFEDSGIGFEQAYLDRIFELFERLHGRQEYEGTGMGLAICRKIAERHNGTLTAASEPGRGSVFVVTLPQHQNKG